VAGRGRRAHPWRLSDGQREEIERRVAAGQRSSTVPEPHAASLRLQSRDEHPELRQREAEVVDRVFLVKGRTVMERTTGVSPRGGVRLSSMDGDTDLFQPGETAYHLQLNAAELKVTHAFDWTGTALTLAKLLVGRVNA
jgi:hypothetical protein